MLKSAGSLSVKAAPVLTRKKKKKEKYNCGVSCPKIQPTSLSLKVSNVRAGKQEEVGQQTGNPSEKGSKSKGNKEMLARFGIHPPLQMCYWRSSLPSSRHWEI